VLETFGLVVMECGWTSALKASCQNASESTNEYRRSPTTHVRAHVCIETERETEWDGVFCLFQF